MTSGVPEELDAAAPEDVDLAAEQAVHDEEPAVVDAGLDGRGRVPGARRQPRGPHERVAARAVHLPGSSTSARSGSASTMLMIRGSAGTAPPVVPRPVRKPTSGHRRSGSDVSAAGRGGARVASRAPNRQQGGHMLWLVIGIVLLVIAIAGGAIVHPILFVLAILALLAFFTGWRGRAAI
jgi:hypothetical protein